MSESIEPTNVVEEPALSAKHLDYLEFLFDVIPLRVFKNDLHDFDKIAAMAKNGVTHFKSDYIRDDKQPDYHPETLFFTKFVGDASILGHYRGPLCVWRLENSEIAVGVSTRNGNQLHQPELVPVLAELLNALMIPSDTIDLSLYFAVWQNHITCREVVYLLERQVFGNLLPPHLRYQVIDSVNWHFLMINIKPPVQFDPGHATHALAVMDPSMLDKDREFLDSPVRIFEVDYYDNKPIFKPIGVSAFVPNLPEIRSRVSKIIEVLKRALLEESLL
jgi:hypothetical protein